jgi:hypothetical protein
MSKAIKAFGVLKESTDSGNYIQQKTNQTMFCSSHICLPKRTFAGQGDLLALRSANQCRNFNKANLAINLLTKLDLENICVIQNSITKDCPTNIDTTAIPFIDYTVDPNGSLFGNTPCGVLNYTSYMIYNPSSMS